MHSSPGALIPGGSVLGDDLLCADDVAVGVDEEYDPLTLIQAEFLVRDQSLGHEAHVWLMADTDSHGAHAVVDEPRVVHAPLVERLTRLQLFALDHFADHFRGGPALRLPRFDPLPAVDLLQAGGEV